MDSPATPVSGNAAALLIGDYRVFALDQRGHGDSERRPDDVSREACVADCAAAIQQFGLGPVTLFGQSMGANTAMLTAAGHPDLVRTLVVIEGSPGGPEPPDSEPHIAAEIGESLTQWPVPLTDEDAAHSFFRSKGYDPIAWTRGLERRPRGLWPRYEIEMLVACIAGLGSRNYWPQWRSIRCPTLVVLSERGIFPAKQSEQIVSQLPSQR